MEGESDVEKAPAGGQDKLNAKEQGKELQQEKGKEADGESEVLGERSDSGSGGQGLDLLKKVHLWTGAGTRTTTLPTSGLNETILALAQLTIVYAGRVSVFDAVPAEKAREIVLIAAAAAANPGDMKNINSNCPTASVLTRSPSLQSSASVLASPRAQLFPAQNSSLCKLQAELPIARRHSLQRFFEKRRDRLVSQAPYSIPSSTRMAENTKTKGSAEASPDAGCFKNSPMLQEEFQPTAAAHFA